MKDEKNKQQRQQPQEDDKGQKKGSDQSMQGKHSSDHQSHGKQSSDHQPTARQGQHPTGEDPSKKSQRQPQKGGMQQQPMDVNEGDMRGDIENPDEQEQPGKKVNIDDDPEQTKKKVPNAHK